MTDSASVPAFAPSRDRFAKDVAMSRASLAEGTPEKYPGAKAVVLIRDAEAVLDENERLRDDLEHTIAFLEATEIPGCRAVATQLREQLSLEGGD